MLKFILVIECEVIFLLFLVGKEFKDIKKEFVVFR